VSSSSSSEHFRRILAGHEPSLKLAILSWGYSPFRSILKRDATTHIGYAIPLRP
jgi:inhibitor of KinA sporulation pathway (predicted exonuclease)